MVTGIIQANPETGFFRQCLLLKIRIFPRNPISLPKSYVSEDKFHYLLMTWGWENGRRLHGCIVHLEFVGDQIWIHEDGLYQVR